MRAPDTNLATTVTAAQRGDRSALTELVSTYLPLVRNVIGRAVDNTADVDDIVQDTMVRAVRDLPSLRSPGSFPTWLTSIAVRQVGTYRTRQESRAGRTTVLEDAVGLPDPVGDPEGAGLLRAELSAQRREVAQAGRWLDPDDRTLLSLWWQEVAGVMNRAEIAATLDLSVAHTGVRIQRMREQLDTARTLVAALAAGDCPELAGLTAGWDGRPDRVWRKRLARHVRTCPVCTPAAQRHMPVERLLASLPALAVPAGLTDLVLAKAAPAAMSGTAATGLKAGLLKLLSTHPLVAAVTSATVAAAVAVPIIVRDGEPETPRTVTAPQATTASPVSESPAPASPSAATIRPGRLSLQLAGGGYLTARDDDVAVIAPAGDDRSRRRATFVAVAGLADPDCYSFRTLDGRYLRHYDLLAYANTPDGTAVFPKDATYCALPGATPDAVILQSHNYPQLCLRWTGTQLRVGYNDASDEFRADSSLRIMPPLAG
ncbi:sigma-70 family RNA polymerase sigma factor [Actinoplanes sp. CA-252034]|uniref:sigma-70 family RNA polymerase sigma factor n=1 Tax=Actinoplanes sp. CA-252034 TaxID=3239906 RepID=UPI003D962727